MEISEPTIGVFYISKILALAPYSLRRNSKGKMEIRRSLPFAFYSITLISIMTNAEHIHQIRSLYGFFLSVFLTYRGLLFDANSKIPVRMKSATSKVVTALDVSVVVLSTTSGVICGLVGLRSSQEINSRLHQVDQTLNSFISHRKEQVRAYSMVFLSLLFISILLGLDIWTWIRVADDMKIDEENTEMNVQWYIPFYSLYYILTGLHISIAHTTFGVGRRYRRLNLTLKKLFLNEEKTTSQIPKNHKKVITVKTISMDFHESVLKKTSNDTLIGVSKNCNMIEHLAKIHESLGICIQNISGSYGFAVLFILVSCLLHLVATAYFLFLEFLSNKNTVYSWLQVLWIVFHTCRLLMIVEPCHLTTMEARQTISLLCQINLNPHDEALTESGASGEDVTFTQVKAARGARWLLRSSKRTRGDLWHLLTRRRRKNTSSSLSKKEEEERIQRVPLVYQKVNEFRIVSDKDFIYIQKLECRDGEGRIFGACSYNSRTKESSIINDRTQTVTSDNKIISV